MLSRHRVSRAAIELIKRFEGYRRTAAQLPDGRWTIGYGHTLTAREGAEVSEADAEALLIYDLIAVQHTVNENVYAPITQNQFDALCSFAFNIGLDNFRRSQVLKRLNAGAAVQAACAMELWRKADFEGERIVVDALVRRRAAEKALFLTPAGDAWVPAPSPILRPAIDLDAIDLVPLRRPVELEASFEGDRITVRREHVEESEPFAAPPPVAPAVSAAAEAVSARLQKIFPDPGQEPEAAHEPEPEATPEPAATSEPGDSGPEETGDLRPQADFAPPITATLELPTSEDETAESPLADAEEAIPAEPEQPVLEEPPLGAERETVPDAELDIPRAPAEPPDEASAPVVLEAQPYEFIPARLRPEPRPKEASLVWDLLLVLLGLVFFGFGLFWGLNFPPAPLGAFVTPLIVALSAGSAGVLLVAAAAYRLLQRLGREVERD
ncbi:MAG: glycoside hydrolase family protein [Pseudomonadota bacterium]